VGAGTVATNEEDRLGALLVAGRPDPERALGTRPSLGANRSESAHFGLFIQALKRK
jgi:hypothetical protein